MQNFQQSQSANQDKQKSVLSRVFYSKTFLAILSLYFIVIIELLAMTVYAQSEVAYSPHTPDLFVPKKTTQPSAKSQPTPAFASTYSYKLTIGSLGVDTGVLSLGVNQKGEMSTPTTLTETSWYNKGPAPGSVGSAVIAGHYGAPWQAGVFRNLQKLKIGDFVSVTDSKGKIFTYKVYKIANVPEKGADLKEIFNKSDGKYLNLITCFGNWNQDSFRYSQRTVVFTKFVN